MCHFHEYNFKLDFVMKYMLIVLFYLTVLILIGKTIPQKFGRLIII